MFTLLFFSSLMVFCNGCTESAVSIYTTINNTSGVWVNTYDSFDNLEILSDNMEVRICSQEEVALHSVISFVGIANLSLIGNDTIILCSSDTQAGLSFKDVISLKISGLIVRNCEVDSRIDDETERNVNASVVIVNSSAVQIDHIKVLDGPGSGLAIFNVGGGLDILDCTFEGNGHGSSTGGNGLYLELSEDFPPLPLPLTYNFFRNNFTNNSADTGKETDIYGFSRFDKGGGLCIFIRGQDGIFIAVENCTFTSNTVASYGGGMFAGFHNDAANSRVAIEGSHFNQNCAQFGGGLYIDYVHNITKMQMPSNCSCIVKFSMFMHNSATYGGGVSIFSTKVEKRNSIGNMSFENCTWKHNSGQFGSAIAI